MSKNYKNIHAKLQGLKPLKISSDLNSSQLLLYHGGGSGYDAPADGVGI